MTLDAISQAQSENLSQIHADTVGDQSQQHGDHLQNVQEKAEVTLHTTTATMQDIQNNLLSFLSGARNDTLIACLVGLGAATYFILGRVGLVLIGVLGGITLQATWEGSPQDVADDALRVAEMKRRKEVGLDVVQRVLQWRDRRYGPNGDRREIDAPPDSCDAADFSSLQPATGTALSNLTDAVLKDYVRYSSPSHHTLLTVN